MKCPNCNENLEYARWDAYQNVYGRIEYNEETKTLEEETYDYGDITETRYE